MERLQATDVDSLKDVRTAFDHDGSIGMDFNDVEWTNGLGIELALDFLVKDKHLITWLVVVVETTLVFREQLDINAKLSLLLESMDVSKQRDWQEHVSVKH